MSKKPEPPLLIELKPSRRLVQLLRLIHLLALAASVANALPSAVKLALFGAICLHFVWLDRRLKKPQYRIKQFDASGWEIANGHAFKPVQILNSTVISRWVIFLHVNNDARKQSILIAHDALSDEDFCRLIVRLKTAAQA